ncbi:Hypothetical predicted protein [Cloeon dipterum]|uniref:methylated diphthine methylhydrolase n=1 Tax=Cloeon dipterum TaxID=197152 RepID=A0A8S1CZW8_9INSE|nr:Hypothetical predicted protein [Cloeon dipterum]
MSLDDLHTVDTVLNADCVAWCPHPGLQSLLLCSTYQLIEGRRTGSLLLFSTAGELRLLQVVVNMQGIFDFKWSPPSMSPIMVAAADSNGHVVLFRLDEASNLLRLVSSTKLADSMALYVDWRESNLAVSFSDGSVSLFEINNSTLSCIQTFKNHSLEAWAAVFDVNDKNILYTGGDDCLLTMTDLRSQQLISKGRYHTAGVTHFMSNRRRPDNFVTGSYDELICLWDSRKLKAPVHELGLGGGVWRIQSENSANPKIAAACMFKGFKFIELNTEGFKEVGDFRSDERCLAYGVAISEENKIAMCTFYDHKLHVSKS